MQQISFKDVSYTYQAGGALKARALSGVNLEIARGEFVVLLGHSGSGKSTLAQLMAGLLLPSTGEVLVNEQKALPKQIFYQVGLVFQYPEQQFFAETVREEVGFAAKNKGLSEEEIAAVVSDSLSKVGLNPEDFLERSPFDLSGGQRRRVAIAGILAMNPQVLIFDEPTAGLDEEGKRWLLALIEAAHQEGKTIIWISHDMEEALWAQRVLVLSEGQVALDGTPKEVFSDSERIRELGLEVPIAAQLLRCLREAGLAVRAEGLSIFEAFDEISEILPKGGADLGGA